MGCYGIRGVSEWGLWGEGSCFKSVFCFLSLALEHLLTELDDFLRILDQENLSSTAVVKKSGLAELLRLYAKSSSECGQGLGEGSPRKQGDGRLCVRAAVRTAPGLG